MGMLRDFATGALEYGLADLKQRGEDERRAKLLELQEQAALKRQMLLEELKTRGEEARAKRDATMRVESEDAARSTLEGKSFEQFKRDLGQTDMSQDQLKQVFREQYFDRDVAPGDANSKRFDPKDSDFTRQGRVEAMKRGASSGLINAYSGQLKEDVANERYADQTERQARLDAQRERNEQARLEQGDRRAAASERSAEAAIIRAERVGSGSGSPKNEDKLSETQKARLDILKRNVLDAEKALGEAGSIKSRREAAQARVDEAYRKLDEFTSQVDGKPTETKPSTPKPPATENKPTAAPPVRLLQEGKQTTFANGQVWTLKNGKPVQVK